MHDRLACESRDHLAESVWRSFGVPEVAIVRLGGWDNQLACPKVVMDWRRVWQSDCRPKLTANWPGECGVSRLDGVGGLRMTQSQRCSSKIPESERKCTPEATQATRRRGCVMGRSGGVSRLGGQTYV